MTTSVRVRSLLKEADLNRDQFLELLALAKELRSQKRSGGEVRQLTG